VPYTFNSNSSDLAALRKKDYNEAAKQMLDSQWRVQTPKRCEELSDLMRSCA
jgi:glutamate formiminotransferase